MLHVILMKLNIVPTFIIEWEPFSCCLFWLLPPPTSDFPWQNILSVMLLLEFFQFALLLVEQFCAPVKFPNAMLVFVWWNLTLSPPVKTKTEFLLTISIQSQVDKQWEYRKISIRDYHLTQYQILQTEIISNVWQTVWRITIELLLDCGSKRVKISVPQAPLHGQDRNTYKSFIFISTVWVKDWWRKPWTTVFLTCKKLAPHSMKALKHLQSI